LRRFRQQIETALQRSVGYQHKARPRKKKRLNANASHLSPTPFFSSVVTASDLYDDGEKLALDMSSINPMGGEAIITPQELLDLTAFLEDPSIM
jgi:hypothetical protein